LKINKESTENSILLEKPLLDPPVSKTKGVPRRIKNGPD